MDLTGRTFLSSRVILSILAGLLASILLISTIENYILATILGLLVAVAMANPEQPRDTAVLGLVTGALTGLYLGWKNSPVSAGLFLDYPVLVTSILEWVVLTSLLCAVYGFVIGKFIELYKKGQGPFF